MRGIKVVGDARWHVLRYLSVDQVQGDEQALAAHPIVAASDQTGLSPQRRGVAPGRHSPQVPLSLRTQEIIVASNKDASIGQSTGKRCAAAQRAFRQIEREVREDVIP